MALVCSVALSATSYNAGATPPPSASIVCYNPGATALVVTGVGLYGRVLGSSTPGNPVPMGAALPPYGPGAPVTVAAGASASVGPFPITVGSAAAGVGGNSQWSQPLDYTLMVGAVVIASDGSRSDAAETGMLVSYTVRPLPGTQGGQLIFSRPSNSAGWFFL
jgi:hypothetical protein